MIKALLIIGFLTVMTPVAEAADQCTNLWNSYIHNKDKYEKLKNKNLISKELQGKIELWKAWYFQNCTRKA